MKLYKIQLLILITMMRTIVADSYSDITKLPPIALENMTRKCFFMKGQIPSNIIFNASGEPIQAWNRNFALMNSATVQNPEFAAFKSIFGAAIGTDNIPVINNSIAAALMNLKSEDWEDGIYFVPYLVDQSGNFVTEYDQFNKGYKGQFGSNMYVALFDHQFNLLAKGAVSVYPDGEVGWTDGNPVSMNWPPLKYMLKLSGVKMVYEEEAATSGSIFFIKAIDPSTQSHLMTPLTNIPSDASLFELPGSGAAEIGAISLPTGHLKELDLQPTFGTAGTATLSLSKISQTVMTLLSNHVNSGSVSVDFVVQQNDIGGYDATLIAYQNGAELFTQSLTETGKGLLNQDGTLIPSHYTMSSLNVAYETDGMSAKRTKPLGLVSQFVLVSTDDTVSSGKMIAKGEYLTQVDVGFVFRMGYSQYTTIVPVPSAYVKQINAQLAQGNDVSFNMALQKGKQYYGVQMLATAGGKQLFNRVLKDIPVVDGSTQKQTVMSNEASVVIENIGYQTNNMNKGILVPNSTSYSFMANKLATITDLSGMTAPTSDHKIQSPATTGIPTVAPAPAPAPRRAPAPAPPSMGGGGFGGRF